MDGADWNFAGRQVGGFRNRRRSAYRLRAATAFWPSSGFGVGDGAAAGAVTRSRKTKRTRPTVTTSPSFSTAVATVWPLILVPFVLFTSSTHQRPSRTSKTQCFRDVFGS